MWTIIKFKESSQRQDLEVMRKVRELKYSGAPDAESLIIDFKKSLTEIRQTNAFTAPELYKMIEQSPEHVEVWKTTVNGYNKYLMFTLHKSKEKFNPFNF